MLSWLTAHLASILVGFLLAVCLALAIRRLVLDRRTGRRSCGCSCKSCGGCDTCHSPH